MEYDEEFQASLPRSEAMDGSDLHISERGPFGDIIVTDGERSASYVPFKGPHLVAGLRIKPAYVEAGWFSEANCITLTDAFSSAVYVPQRKAGPSS